MAPITTTTEVDRAPAVVFDYATGVCSTSLR